MNQIKTGRFIASLRKEIGMTQEMLGEKLGVTNKTISRWETGVYMPDIKMLKLLSEFFSVSINELLSGERLSDTDFRKEADKNIIAASTASAFSLKEKTDFWKRKWIKEHIPLIAIAVLLCMGILAFAVIKSISWLSGLTALIWLVEFGFLRNKMMIYIEDQVFGHQSNNAK